MNYKLDLRMNVDSSKCSSCGREILLWKDIIIKGKSACCSNCGTPVEKLTNSVVSRELKNKDVLKEISLEDEKE